MKAHRYQVEVYESTLDVAHNVGEIQDRLYIPGMGVIGYRKERIDFFSDDPKSMGEAEDLIENKTNYSGEIDLPDKSVRMVVDAGRRLVSAKTHFNIITKGLIALIGE